jgi:hypothetical protein
MGCSHTWVTYQPFRGEAYVCCATAGCGITYNEYLASQNKVLREEEANEWLSSNPWAQAILPQGSAKPLQPSPGKLTPRKGWTPVSYADYGLSPKTVIIDETVDTDAYIKATNDLVNEAIRKMSERLAEMDVLPGSKL